jgi:hypothetical protein
LVALLDLRNDRVACLDAWLLQEKLEFKNHHELKAYMRELEKDIPKHRSSPP